MNLQLCLIREFYPDTLIGKDYLCRDMFNEIIKSIDTEKHFAIMIVPKTNDFFEAEFICGVCNTLIQRIEDNDVCGKNANISFWCTSCHETYILCYLSKNMYQNSIHNCINQIDLIDDTELYKKIVYICWNNGCEYENNTFYKVYYKKITHLRDVNSKKAPYEKAKKSSYKISDLKFDNNIDTDYSGNILWYKAYCENCKTECISGLAGA